MGERRNTPVDLLMLLGNWDELDIAINRVVVAQPSQMTAAAANLEQSRAAFRDLIQSYAFDAASKGALTNA